MATKVTGNDIKINHSGKAYYMRAMYYYTVSTNSDTTYTLTLYGGMNMSATLEFVSSGSYTSKMTGTGQTAKTVTGSTNKLTAGDHTYIASYTWSWPKTHASQSVTVTCNWTYTIGGVPMNSQATKTFTIPAKSSYSVTYNANSGSGAPNNQTKWYNETLTLSSVAPTKDGYIFKGWATTAARAGSGYVDYSPGGTYTGNNALTLYAVWELAYAKPIIDNISVERCQSDGTTDDVGQYALVTFDWSIYSSANARYYGGSTYPYSSNAVDNCTITVGTETATPTLTGTSGTEPIVVGSGAFDPETQYDVTISITDTQAVYPSSTTTVNEILATTNYPMDYNSDATAVGFFMPAPDNGNGAYFGRDVYVSGDISGSDITATGDISGVDITASGDVTDGTSNVLSNKADKTDVKNISVVSKSGSTGSISAAGYKNLSLTPTAPTGKSLVGCVGVHIEGTNSSYCQLIGFYVNGSDVHVQMKNTSSGSVNWTCTVDALYV